MLTRNAIYFYLQRSAPYKNEFHGKKDGSSDPEFIPDKDLLLNAVDIEHPFGDAMSDEDYAKVRLDLNVRPFCYLFLLFAQQTIHVWFIYLVPSSMDSLTRNHTDNAPTRTRKICHF